MKIKYCLPIIKNSKEEVLQEVLQNMDSYDFFEVWIDYIENSDESFIKNLTDKYQERLILVFRRKNLEKTKLSFEQRIKILFSLENAQTLVDLDITTQKEELNYIKNQGLKVSTIISYHNYEATPSDKNLKEIINIMKPYRPTIFKIATMCTNSEEAFRLLQFLLYLKKENLPYIVLGMGQTGNITRIFGTLWGNQMIFAPYEKRQQSAPGQLTKSELETIFDILKN